MTMKKIIAILFCMLVTSLFLVRANDYPFEVTVRGTGQPAILIPGLGCSGDVWQQTVDSLSHHYECHVLTLAGFAGVPPVDLSQGYLPQISQGLVNYIKEKLDEKPVIIGHSLGGFLALTIAADNPGIAKKLVIVDSYPFMPLAFNPQATEENVKAQALQIKQMILHSPDSIFAMQQQQTLQTMVTDKQQAALAAGWTLQSDRPTLAQAMYELMTTDLCDEIAAIQVPVLVMGSWYGARSYGVTREMVAANLRAQYQNVANCRIILADTALHFIMWDEPAWFINSLADFLGDEV